jgi:class 3 adenylate cyclase
VKLKSLESSRDDSGLAGAEQVLRLADRLRESNGGELDDSAILAVAEATGAPIDYVRLVITTQSTSQNLTPFEKIRKSFLGFDPGVRNILGASVFASGYVLFSTLHAVVRQSFYNWTGLLSILTFLSAFGAVAMAGTSRDKKSALLAGLVGGAGAAIMGAFLRPLFGQPGDSAPIMILMAVLGTVLASVFHVIYSGIRHKLGLKDPISERQELLQQLVQIQDKLKENEQPVTFLSVDIVGSTKMKQLADRLSVEFTLNEYHKYAETIARKHFGRVHSTAGDGITMAFDSPQSAVSAAKNFQAGLIELNTFRNKIGAPIRVRIGVHTGTVIAPDAGDIRSVNFASVIDIAAHLQKECPPGMVAVSENTALMSQGGPSALGQTWIEVSGTRAVLWGSRAMSEGEKQKSGPPPPPI